MINHIKAALFSTLQKTVPYQFLSACSSKTISAFKRYVPVDLAREKISFYRTTNKLIQEHKTVIGNTNTNISTAIAKDLKPIEELSILLANDIIIHCFPSQGLNPLYTEYYDKKREGFADFLLEKSNVIEKTSLPEYKERQIALFKLSTSVKNLLLDNLTSNDHTFFKGPLIKPLSSFEGTPLDFLDRIGAKKGSIPQELCIIIKYEKGALTAALKAKSALVNATKFSTPVPHIAEVADLASEHFQEYKTQRIYHNCLYAKVVKGLQL